MFFKHNEKTIKTLHDNFLFVLNIPRSKSNYFYSLQL